MACVENETVNENWWECILVYTSCVKIRFDSFYTFTFLHLKMS